MTRSSAIIDIINKSYCFLPIVKLIIVLVWLFSWPLEMYSTFLVRINSLTAMSVILSIPSSTDTFSQTKAGDSSEKMTRKYLSKFYTKLPELTSTKRRCFPLFLPFLFSIFPCSETTISILIVSMLPTKQKLDPKASKVVSSLPVSRKICNICTFKNYEK